MWEGMSLDQINEFKQECQDLMPVVELMKIRAGPDSLMGLDRDVRLTIMGYSEAEIEDMTGYKRNEPAFDPDINLDETEIFISDKDFPDKLKAVKIKVNAERESEFSRILNFGIRLGFIEEEEPIDPKL
jgi:hypothetical protein